MLKITRQLFSLWNDNDIVYCHWKGNGHLEDALDGKSDFDVLISEDSYEQGCLLLVKAGYMLCNTQVEARYPGIQDWIGVDSANGTMIHIHLHKKMIAGRRGVMEYILPWTDLAFSTRQMDENTGIYLLNPNLEIIMLLMRFGIEHNSKKLKKVNGGWELKSKTKQELNYLRNRINLAICQNFSMELFPTCYEQILRLIQKENLTSADIKELARIMNKPCKKWLRFSKTTFYFLSWYKPIETKLRRKYINSNLRGVYRKTPYSGRGLSVAFIGKDGSGRTMLAYDIYKWLTWKLDANYIYTGNYNDTPPQCCLLCTNTTECKYYDSRRWAEIRRLTNKGIKLKGQGSIILFDKYPICEGNGKSNVLPKPDLVINVEANLSYEEELLLIKNTIWNRLISNENAQDLKGFVYSME